MLKLLGSICVLSGGLLVVGQQRAMRRRRRDTLSELIMALRRMVQEIRMTREPLPVLLEALGKSCDSAAADFFSSVSLAARQGESLSCSWQQAAQKLPLSKEVCSLIGNLGNSLQGDEENVCNVISLVIYELVKHAGEWDKQHPEEEKRMAALWMSGAALLVILLI